MTGDLYSGDGGMGHFTLHCDHNIMTGGHYSLKIIVSLWGSFYSLTPEHFLRHVAGIN